MTPCYDGPLTRSNRLEALARGWGGHKSMVAGVDFEVVYVTPDDSLPAELKPQLRVPDQLTNGGPGRSAGRVQRWVMSQVVASSDPDFLVLCEDHTFIIKENLACYLRTLDPSHRVYAGHTLVSRRSQFNTNAAGFVLSRASLQVLLKMSESGTERSCDPTQPQWLSLCVANAGFAPLDTKVDRAQRFNVYGPVRLVRGDVDPWFKSFHTFDYGRKAELMPTGPDCCAPQVISFHYVMPEEHAHLYSIVYEREKFLKMTWEQLAAAWPTAHVEKNFRPRDDDAGLWSLLLQKLEVCSE